MSLYIHSTWRNNMSFDSSKFEFYYKSFKNGNYFGAKPSEETLESIESLMKKLKISKPIGLEDIHVTLMYSEDKGNPMIPPSSDLEYKASASKFALFGPNKDCLVIKLDSDDLKNRHNQLLAHGFIHSYDEYSPHITLSYNYEGDLPSSDLLKDLGELVFGNEYVMAIDDSWSDDK